MYMAAMAFSAIVEPLVLYVARYKLTGARDAQTVISVTLISFMAFDLFHSAASVSVSGFPAAIPSVNLDLRSPQLDCSKMDLYASINFWVPLVWLAARSLWLSGVGREVAVDY